MFEIAIFSSNIRLFSSG